MRNMSSCLSIKHIALCKASKIKTQCSANSYPGTLRQLDELLLEICILLVLDVL